MMGVRLNIVCICLMLNYSLTHAQLFKTEQLKRAATVLGIENSIDSLDANQTLTVFSKDGLAIAIRTDKYQKIEHIGIPLFNDSLRILIPSPVYDFMEYAVLNWKYKISPNTLYLSKVIFRKGSWDSLTNSRLYQCDCSIENVDDRIYIVTWQLDSTEVAQIGIPIEYELLCNESRRNIEKIFIDQLSCHQPSTYCRHHKDVTEKDLKIYGTEGMFVIDGQSYLLPEVNQNVYYTLKTIYEPIDTVYLGVLTHMVLEDVLPVLVKDEEHPIETFANLIMSDDTELPDVKSEMDFHLSNYHHRLLTLPLSHLKDYCKDQGDNIYFAVTGMTPTNIKGMMFVTNTSKGYNHLFSLNMTKHMLMDDQPVMKVNAYLYIPPISKEKLFGKMPTKKSGAKIY